MKKYISLFFAASLALVACQKEQLVDDARVSEENQGSGKLYTYTFLANADETKMKLGAYGKENNTPALWEEAEAVSAFQTSDASNVGTATLISDPGAQTGQFSLETMAAPGTKVRMIYPSDAEYGKGTVPASQKNPIKDGIVFAHAYSDEITLDASSQAAFSLKHALATVLVTFKADPAGIFGDSESRVKFMNNISIRSLAGLALAGDYTVDYETGVVTVGKNASDKVSLNRGAGFSKYANTACFTVLPTGKVSTYEIVMDIQVGSSEKGDQVEKYSLPILFSGEFKANQVNYIDLGLISTKPEYLDNGHDYYAKWLAGADIVVDTEEGHEMVINKTNYPTCTVVRANQITQYSAIWDKGLVFIDDCKGEINLCKANSNEQKQFGSNNPVVVVGRWKDFGSQPVLQVHEIRGTKNDLTFLNVGIRNMRQSGGAVFGAMGGTSVCFSLRVKDCRIDARNAQNVVDLQPNNTTTATKHIGYSMFDNCIVDMPRSKYASDNGTDVRKNYMSFYTSSKTPYSTESKNIVKNSILYTSEKVLYAETKNDVVYKGNGREFLVYLLSKNISAASFIFKNNTVANFSNSYGLCYFKNSTVGGFVFDDNLCFAEDATEAEGANKCVMTRNDSNTWSTQAHILGNVGTLSNWPSGNIRSYRAIHDGYKFETVTGIVEDCGYTYIVDESIGNKYPFTVKNYTTGFMKVNTSISKLLKAGARTDKKYISNAAE